VSDGDIVVLDLPETAGPDQDGGAPGRRRLRFDWRDLVAVAVVLAGFALPLRGLLRYQGPPMEEGFMLVFPQEVLRGAVPHVDFLHLYGPGSLWVLAGVYKLFGESLATERIFGLLQHMGIVFGVFAVARPWGRRVAVTCALTSLVIVLPPIGLTALAWNGAVALALWAVWTASRSSQGDDHNDSDRRPTTGSPRHLLIAGILAGFALLYRPDLVLALSLGLGAAVWRPTVRRLRPLMAGLLIGIAPVMVLVAEAGIGPMVQGMVIDPVFRLRPGRSLPVPPSWNQLDGWLQKAAGLRTLGWPLPAPSSAQQVAIWFYLVPFGVLFVLGTGVWAVRRDPHRAQARALRTVGFFGLGLLTQAFQRPDTAHFAWVSCVPLALVPVAVTELVRGRSWPSWRRSLTAIAPVAVLVLALIPHYTIRTYVDLSEQSFGRNVFGYPVNHDGRNFYYGSKDAADAANDLAQVLGTRSRPGQRLFVGPVDLRQTPYSDAFFYYLFPKLVPATYFIEMDPGIANAKGSRLPADVASADWLILSNVWTGWTEPNASRHVGPDTANEVVRRRFCSVQRFGDKGGGEPWFVLYRRCR
jgi:hypothetical protein